MVHIKVLEKYKKYHFHGGFLVLAVFFFIGIVVGGYIQQKNFDNFVSSFKNIREGSAGFSFINPLLGNISAPATDVGIYTDIHSDIKNYLEDEKKNGNLYNYSFYFRDLNSPLWFGVDEDVSFFPASLFKLPIAIVIYRQAESDPLFLSQKLVYTQEMKDINKSTYGNEDSSLVVGKAYSVEELVEIMLEFSDNGAKDLLSSVIDQNYVSNLFNSMALVDPSSATSYEISSRKYAFFLRILYNSSYLTKEHSEQILLLLSKSTFKKGLVAGIPGDVVVAHKFGTRQSEITINGVNKTASVLSDCGIVYNKESPYVICLMTEGKDINVLLDAISKVSEMTYKDAQEE